MAAHAALALTPDDRREYLFVLASLLGLTPNASPEAVLFLRQTCQALEADPETEAATLSAALRPNPTRIRMFCERLRGSHLRATLVGDLLQLAYIDGNYSVLERESIENVSRFLGLSFVQLDQLSKYAERVAATAAARMQLADRSAAETTEVKANLWASVAAFFLPLIAITFAGQGLSSEAFSSGLRTLSMGMGTLGAFAVLALSGFGAFMMVRSMFPQARIPSHR